jgi:hypothetical protein
MKIRTVVGYCLFGVCILFTFVRGRVLEIEHVAGIDAAYYIGLVSGILVMIAFILLGGCGDKK